MTYLVIILRVHNLLFYNLYNFSDTNFVKNYLYPYNNQFQLHENFIKYQFRYQGVIEA